MNLHTHRTTWMCWGAGLCFVGAALAQTSQPSGGAVNGVIKGNNVYVRSGFSTNYYPVTKLNSGDQVQILREEHGWLEIVPPVGTFSVISSQYVERNGDTGTVTGNNVQVYAGSSLSKDQYARQVKLNKGDKVHILGETADGKYYKIDPPPGATLWVKADFVDRSGNVDLAASPRPVEPALEIVPPGTLAETPKPVEPVRTQTRPARDTSADLARVGETPAARRATENKPDYDKYQIQINAIEAEIKAESQKPVSERRFDHIIAKLEPIAAQDEDEVSKIYATTRINQLRGSEEIARAVAEIEQLRSTAIATADEIARERERIRARGAIQPDGIVISGEIRASSIYDGLAGRAKRWRLVNPKTNRTVAYIELPEGSEVRPEDFYGKYVGIRAYGYRILKDTIPPVPVYTTREIVLAEPPPPEIESDKSRQPSVPVISVPSTQPTGEDGE
mgnify:CR=1 FL=1